MQTSSWAKFSTLKMFCSASACTISSPNPREWITFLKLWVWEPLKTIKKKSLFSFVPSGPCRRCSALPSCCCLASWLAWAPLWTQETPMCAACGRGEARLTVTSGGWDPVIFHTADPFSAQWTATRWCKVECKLMQPWTTTAYFWRFSAKPQWKRPKPVVTWPSCFDSSLFII